MLLEVGKKYRLKNSTELERALAGNYRSNSDMLAMGGRVVTIRYIERSSMYPVDRIDIEEDGRRYDWVPNCFEPVDSDSKEPESEKQEIPVPGTLIHFIDRIIDAPGLGDGGGIGWNGSMEKYGNTTTIVTEVNENTKKKNNPCVKVRGNSWSWSLDSFVVIGPAPCLKLGEWHSGKECSTCVNKCELTGEGRFDP